MIPCCGLSSTTHSYPSCNFAIKYFQITNLETLVKHVIFSYLLGNMMAVIMVILFSSCIGVLRIKHSAHIFVPWLSAFPSFPPTSPIIVTLCMTSGRDRRLYSHWYQNCTDRLWCFSLQISKFHLLHSVCLQSFSCVISTSGEQYSEMNFLNNYSFCCNDDDPIF